MALSVEKKKGQKSLLLFSITLNYQNHRELGECRFAPLERVARNISKLGIFEMLFRTQAYVYWLNQLN